MTRVDRLTPYLMHVRDAAGPTLVPLGEAPDLKVADGEPDIRGWRVRTRAGSEIGEVADLVVDAADMQVRYMDVRLASAVADDHRHVLVPIGVAQLDTTRDDVHVDTGAASLLDAPPYRPELLDRQYERTLLESYGWRSPAPGIERVADFYRAPHFDERSCFAHRRARAHRPYLAPAGAGEPASPGTASRADA